MHTQLFLILIWTTTLSYEQGQNDIYIGTNLIKVHFLANKQQRLFLNENKQFIEISGKNINQKTKNKAEFKINIKFLDGLNGMTLQSEPFNSTFKSKVDDSAHVLLPIVKTKGGLFPINMMWVRGLGSSSSRFDEHRLGLNAAGFAAADLQIINDTATGLEATMLADSEAIKLKFKQPLNQPIDTSKNQIGEVNNCKSPARNKADSSSVLVKYLIIFLIATGVLLLLWTISRFLVYSVAKKPLSPKKTVFGSLFKNWLPDPSISRGEQMVEGLNIQRHEQTIDQLGTKAELIVDENQSLKSGFKPVILHPAHGTAIERYFLSEVMMTAGPRKKYMSEPDADKDLGEDVCGFLSDSNQVLLWLLDGTSDQYCLIEPDSKREYFSSRLLAQCVAYKMRYAFKNINDSSLFELIEQAVGQVKSDWLQVIAELPAKERDVIKTNIEKRNVPECATTLLVGHLSIEGNLTAYRSGDSKMTLYKKLLNGKAEYIETGLSRKNDESNDRLFFRLVLNQEGKIDILFNKPNFEIISQDKVQTLIIFSDGIGMETERLLKQQNNMQLDEIRNIIIHQTQGTADDKTFCFVEINEA